MIVLCFLLTNSYLQLYISDTIYNNTSFLILFNLTCKTCSITLIWSKLCLMTKTGTEFRSDLLKFTLFSCHCYHHSTVTFPLFSNLVRRFLIINNWINDKFHILTYQGNKTKHKITRESSKECEPTYYELNSS